MKITVLSHIYTGKSLALVYQDASGLHSKVVEASHVNWKQVEKAYKAQDLAKVVELIDVAKAINSRFQGQFVVKDGAVHYNGEQVHGYIFDRIIFFLQSGLPYQRLLKFAQNLYSNPSEKARNELFKFLEHKNMPITDDGCFMAYKGVQSDFWSITGGDIKIIKGKVDASGRVFNGIGEEIECERTDVDSDASHGCAKGLHVGSFEYANGFKGSGKLVIVKVNPRDVVSVPNDCSCQKLRSCRYEVLAENGGKVLHEVKNSNFDKVAKLRQGRDANGRFLSTKN